MRTTLWIGVGLLLGVCLNTFGCGRKAPPYLAEKSEGLKVEALQIQRADGKLTLSARLGRPRSETDPGENLTVRLYHSRYDPDNAPCEGCPIRFRLFREAEVPREGEYFSFKVADIEETGIHFFMVRLVGEHGRLSSPSNRVKLRIK